MFCGIGGFRLGLEKSGWKCLWANDNNKHACKIYRKNFGDKELVESDIREISTDFIPDHTLLTAGFPCQTFSIAGRRKATKEARGTLFAHIIRVASAKRPPLLLLENVKGLLSSELGRTFATILRTLGNLGYILEWQVLNSKHFGVPQNRERVFIIGHLRGSHTAKIFPIAKIDPDLAETPRQSQKKGTRIRVANPFGAQENFKAPRIIANTLSARDFKDGARNLIQLGVKQKGQCTRIYDPKGISPALNANTGGYHIPQIIEFVAKKKEVKQ